MSPTEPDRSYPTTKFPDFTKLIYPSDPVGMVDEVIRSLSELRLQIEKVMKQLEWAWTEKLAYPKQVELLDRFEVLQHTLDVHIEGSKTMLENIKRNRIEVKYANKFSYIGTESDS